MSQLMIDDFSQCLVLNTRMAARAVTRRADRQLRPYGVTAAQFTIIGALSTRPGRPVTDIAASIAMDRTTLSRNVDLLEAKGLVHSEPAEQGNGRLCTLTDEGRRLLDQLRPVWREAQDELRAMLADPDFPTIIAALKEVAGLT